MKLQLSQALATVLNIQIVPFRDADPDGPKIYVTYIGGEGGIQQQVGVVGESTLDQAIWKAMEVQNLSQPSSFAVFPIKSGREDYYMSIERELLRQETSVEFNGKLMWQMLPASDPRELIEMIMLQIRECAQAIMHPVTFQESLLRVACLIISCMQWTSNWITSLRLRQAALQAQQPEQPKVVDFPPPAQEVGLEGEATRGSVPPLFGVAGLQAMPPATTEVTVIDGGDGVPPLILRKEKDAGPEPKPKQPETPPSKGPGNGKRKRSRKRNRH